MANLKLLLHLNGADGATTTTDSSPSGHTVNAFNGTAELDTGVTKFGSATLLLDGDSDWIDINDHADWDVLSQNSFTIDLWVKHTDHVGNEYYIEQEEDDNNRWRLWHIHGTGLEFSVDSGGGAIIQLNGGEITDTDWHHVAVVKVGNLYGIYKDGTQVAYASDASTDTFAGGLYIGASPNAGGENFFQGSIDEVRVTYGNVFGAAPNATPDDTITTPTAEHPDRDVGGGMGIIL